MPLQKMKEVAAAQVFIITLEGRQQYQPRTGPGLPGRESNS